MGIFDIISIIWWKYLILYQLFDGNIWYYINYLMEIFDIILIIWWEYLILYYLMGIFDII